MIAIYINRNGKSLNSNIGFKIVLIFNLIFCLIWFLKFPVYRFGSGILISTIVITLVILLKNFNSDNFLRIIKITVPLLSILLISKSSDRIIDRVKNNYIHYPWINIYSDNYEKKITYKKIYFSNNKKKYYYSTKNNEICYFAPAPCTHRVKKINYKKFASYDLIFKYN